MAIVTGSTPFGLGQTYYSGRTVDTSNYGGINLEGQVCTFTNVTVPSGSTTLRTPLNDGPIQARLVRNVSGITLLPGRLVIYKAGFQDRRVDGYSAVTATRVAGVVDPWLNTTTGVPNGDVFWCVFYGTVPVLRSLSNSAADDAEGDTLYAITAATSQATTAGRFTRWVGTFSAAETTDGSAANIITNQIGKAMSACTTAGTNQRMNVRLRIDN